MKSIFLSFCALAFISCNGNQEERTGNEGFDINSSTEFEVFACSYETLDEEIYLLNGKSLGKLKAGELLIGDQHYFVNGFQAYHFCQFIEMSLKDNKPYLTIDSEGTTNPTDCEDERVTPDVVETTSSQEFPASQHLIHFVSEEGKLIQRRHTILVDLFKEGTDPRGACQALID